MEKSDQKRTEISRSLRVKNRGSDDAIRRQFGSDFWGNKGRDFWGINSDTVVIKPYTGHFWQVVFDRRFSFFKTLGIGLGLTPRGGTEIRPENDEKITDLPLEERFLQRLLTAPTAPALTAKASQSAIPHTKRFFCDKMDYLGTTGTVRNDCRIRCFASRRPSGTWPAGSPAISPLTARISEGELAPGWRPHAAGAVPRDGRRFPVAAGIPGPG